MSDGGVVDFSALSAFTGGDESLMGIHIKTFMSFAPAQVQLLKSKVEEKEWSDVRNIAHQLKPKLAYMGIKQLDPVIKSIETLAGEERDVEQIPGLVSEVETISQKAFDELSARMNS